MSKDFEKWFTDSNFGGDMWGDFRKAHKQITHLIQQLAESENLLKTIHNRDVLPPYYQEMVTEYLKAPKC